LALGWRPSSSPDCLPLDACLFPAVEPHPEPSASIHRFSTGTNHVPEKEELMNGTQFDCLSRSLIASSSRRDLVRAFTSAGIGALVGWPANAPDVEARKRKKRKRRKKRGTQDASGGSAVPGGGQGHGNSGGDPPPPPCIPTCTDTFPCGPDGCGGSCGSCNSSEQCVTGVCVCKPDCAASNACDADGCGGSCGSCDASETCDNGTITTHVCKLGVCTPVLTPCQEGQVCFFNECCTPLEPSSCRTERESDGCGGFYPRNCAQVCCAGESGDLVCKPAQLCDDF
jgi:hypothetical protein